MAEVFVLDTSAWIALDEREPGAEEVEAILTKAWLGEAEAHACFATLTELEYIRTQEQDAQQATELLTFAKSQPVQWLHSDDALCSSAAKLKAAHKVSFADAFVAATAPRLNALLVHKDPEFDVLNGVIKLHALPPKVKKASQQPVEKVAAGMRRIPLPRPGIGPMPPELRTALSGVSIRAERSADKAVRCSAVMERL